MQLGECNSGLLIGKNGSGKSTVVSALILLQKIARGVNRIGSLVNSRDFFLHRTDVPMRFEIEAELRGRVFEYRLALELPVNFRELRVVEELFLVDGRPLLQRTKANVEVSKSSESGARFAVDWHLAALPLILETSKEDPIFLFREWLAHALIFQPVPSRIVGESEGETLFPEVDGCNYAAWVSGLLAYFPKAYAELEGYLKTVLPDFDGLRNPTVGAQSRSLVIDFAVEGQRFSCALEELSSGEKYYFLCATILAAIRTYGPLFCFWDEPDSHISLPEVGHLIGALRRAFREGNQILVTSHHPEAIRHFGEDSTLVLQRRSHLEPSQVRWLKELEVEGDLVENLIRGLLD